MTRPVTILFHKNDNTRQLKRKRKKEREKKKQIEREGETKYTVAFFNRSA